MLEQRVWQPVFMTPSHSFDYITLQVLSALEFRYVTDGYGVFSYKTGVLNAVPQLFATPKHFGFGVYTICLHTNNMTELEIQNMLLFMKTHRKQIISFDKAVAMSCSLPYVATTSRLVTSAALKTIRKVRRLLSTLAHSAKTA